MKNEAISIIALLILVISLTVTADESETFSVDVDIIAGCIKEVNFTVNNDESKKVVCYLNTTILPDGEGINITYSTGEVFVLNGTETIKVTMFIKADMLLMPQTYYITTDIYFEKEKSSGSSGKGTYWKSGTSSDEKENETEPPKDEQEPDVPENNISDVPDIRGEVIKGDGTLVLFAALALALMATIVAIFLYFKVKDRKRDKEE